MKGSAQGCNRLYKFVEGCRLTVCTRSAWTGLASPQQVSSHKDMGGRIGLPVLEKLLYVPERKLIYLSWCPSGSGSDVAIQKRPGS
jgi:hypothetical protein